MTDATGPGPTVHAVGFPPWKQPLVRAFLPEHRVRFVRRAEAVPAGATALVWGSGTEVPGAARVLRLEDGFLRSVGLGATLVRPLSWVVDARGIYYDARRPSGLEALLQEGHFDAALRERARRLRAAIVTQGLTKYNVGASAWHRPADGRAVVLVPGQVETDASIAHGAADLRTNLALLRASRAARPDAHLVYKPHPDVQSGLRRRGIGEADAARVCDEIVADVPLHVLLEQVDEVHVLTSLAGFEALLRERPVVCWGQPFYAGWGLTEDRTPPARRTARRTLDELVAAALILYPRYLARTADRLIAPEEAVDELRQWRDTAPPDSSLALRTRRLVMGAYNRARGR